MGSVCKGNLAMSRVVVLKVCLLSVFAMLACCLGGCQQKMVTITSDPNGAEVYLNGVNKGITTYRPEEPLDFANVDQYDVLLKKHGYFDGKTTILYEPKDEKEYHVALEKLSKLVTIQSEPAGATVFIDGMETGITNQSTRVFFNEMDDHEVVLKKSGYYDKTFRIEFEPSEQNLYPQDPVLEKIVTTEIVLIEVRPTFVTGSMKLKVVHKPTLAYLEEIERSPNVRSVTRVTNNEDPNVSMGGPVLSPREDVLVYEVIAQEDSGVSYSNLWRTTIGSFGQTRVTYGKWLDIYPAFTPDGNDLFLSTNRVGGNTLWRIKIAGSGGLTKITNTLAQDLSPSVSPDGAVIAYTSLPPDAEGAQIWTVGRDGTLPTQLREGESPQISPDGKQILFVRQDKIIKKNQIWLMDLDGGRETQLTQNIDYNVVDARWSPDGQYIVFSSDEGLDSKRRQNSDIWLMTQNGSQKTQLTTNGSVDDRPCWDGQGKYIYFRSNRGGVWNIWRFEPVMVQ